MFQLATNSFMQPHSRSPVPHRKIFLRALFTHNCSHYISLRGVRSVRAVSIAQKTNTRLCGGDCTKTILVLVLLYLIAPGEWRRDVVVVLGLLALKPPRPSGDKATFNYLHVEMGLTNVWVFFTLFLALEACCWVRNGSVKRNRMRNEIFPFGWDLLFIRGYNVH